MAGVQIPPNDLLNLWQGLFKLLQFMDLNPNQILYPNHYFMFMLYAIIVEEIESCCWSSMLASITLVALLNRYFNRSLLLLVILQGEE